MAQKSFGEIVKQSVAISAFVGIGIVLLGNVTGNQHWYKSNYGIKEEGLENLENMPYAAVKKRYEQMIKDEEDRRRRTPPTSSTSD